MFAFAANLKRHAPCLAVMALAQVKLMGDFDGWSRGVDLSAEDTSGDSVFTRFSATLLLPKVIG